MAGGAGTRLHPLTLATNKHLLPIYNKPLVYYPISTLMLAGIKEILIITNSDQLINFKKLLGSGREFGIDFFYETQGDPNGIAEGLIIGNDFIKNNKVAFILGDNIFHGVGLGRQLNQFSNVNGAHGFCYQVKDPERYGVVEIDNKGRVISLEEKPQAPKSSLALTGLYFYDELVVEFVKTLKPSSRGELEITDLNNSYLRQGKFNVTTLSAGTAWLDTGTFDSMNDASTYIKIIEERQGAMIGDLRSIAINQGWI